MTYLIFEFLNGFSDGLVLIRVEIIVLYEESGHHSASTFLLHTQSKGKGDGDGERESKSEDDDESQSDGESDGEKKVWVVRRGEEEEGRRGKKEARREKNGKMKAGAWERGERKEGTKGWGE
jgi:hypothetical protein